MNKTLLYLQNVLINPQLAAVVTPELIGSGLSPDVLLDLLKNGWQVPLQMIDRAVLSVTSIIKVCILTLSTVFHWHWHNYDDDVEESLYCSNTFQYFVIPLIFNTIELFIIFVLHVLLVRWHYLTIIQSKQNLIKNTLEANKGMSTWQFEKL